MNANTFSMVRFLLFLALMGPVPVEAQTYLLQIGNIQWAGGTAGYNPFDNNAYPNTVNFTIMKNHPGVDPYAVTAGVSSTSGTYNRKLACGSSLLNYQIYTTAAMNYVLKQPAAAVPSEVISGTCSLPKPYYIPLSFVVVISPGQVVPPGTYTDTVTVSIYQSYNDNGVPMTSATITIQAVVSTYDAMCLVSTGGAWTGSTSQNMDFGTLTAGETVGCDLLVQHTGNCMLAFSSGNGGVLKQNPLSVPDQISYSFQLNGSVLDLKTTGTLSLSGQSPNGGTRLPISVQIGDIGWVTDGTYQDQIMITITAQ